MTHPTPADLLARAAEAPKTAREAMELAAKIAEQLASEAVGAEKRQGYGAETATTALHRFQCENIADAIRAAALAMPDAPLEAAAREPGDGWRPPLSWPVGKGDDEWDCVKQGCRNAETLDGLVGLCHRLKAERDERNR